MLGKVEAMVASAAALAEQARAASARNDVPGFASAADQLVTQLKKIATAPSDLGLV